MTLKFNKTYSLFFIVILALEILIAIYLKSGFVRHTFGDFLAVICLYCFFKSFLNAEPIKIAILVLIIAYIIEFLQLINVLSFLGLQNNDFIRILLGSTFNLTDFLAYTLGIVSVIIIEYKIYKLWIT